MSSEDDITIKLSRDQALVLFEFLARTDDGKDIASEAERKVLMYISGKLERSLPGPYDDAYKSLLKGATERITEDERRFDY